MRIKRLRKILKERMSFPYLITDLNNIKYLTGFSGTNASIVVDENVSYFITDSRYEEYALALLPKNFKFILQQRSMQEAVKECLGARDRKSLFVESHSITLKQQALLKKELKKIKIIPLHDDPVNFIRMEKDNEEIAVLREAASITDNCFYHLLKFIKTGMTEWDIAAEIENYFKRHGCRSCSFDPIVASGSNSSMPHYTPSMDKKIARGEVLLIDMGCIYKGYNSDLTRTIFIGETDKKFTEIYNIVLEAQIKSIEAVRPGLGTSELDNAARSIISDYGYAEEFGHGLGHGLGIEVHEMPAVKKNDSIALKKNMVITIEPGIYISGFGGVRIEDMVLVTADGCEVLTKCTKELIVI
ncbi:MAG: Xaa-Pro peptidase family protein [Leptospirales bacterium]|nr:Xaa-Pro peptidase family protein [Leptospirales bacterium]